MTTSEHQRHCGEIPPRLVPELGRSLATHISATNEKTSIYRHDGQMTFQESRSNGERIDQAMGARGIDWMQKTVGTNSNVFFPLYDAHGNMVATLSRAGTGWSLSDQRSYDAWGQVRAGVANGDPSARYCANLGHKQDDESGLVYMRARYYEPGSGRFISEDPAGDSGNWYEYAYNNPINLVDYNGNNPAAVICGIVNVFGTAVGGFVGYSFAVLFINSLYPGYKSDYLTGAAVSGLVSLLGGGFGMLGTAGKDTSLLMGTSLRELTKTLTRSLAQTGCGAAVRAGGIGFAIGFMFGVYAALLEFFVSSTYSDAWGEVFEN